MMGKMLLRCEREDLHMFCDFVGKVGLGETKEQRASTALRKDGDMKSAEESHKGVWKSS